MLAASGFSSYALGALAMVVGARLAMSAVIIGRVLGLPELVRDIWLVPLKDLLMTGVWFASLVSNQVLWGGRRFQIMPGGAIRELP